MLIKLLKLLILEPRLYFGPLPGTTFSEPDKDQKLLDIQLQYGFGDCSYLAVALSKAYGGPMVNFYNAAGEIFHSAVAIDEFSFMDVYGICSAEAICARYGVSEEYEIEPTDAHDSYMLYPYTDGDIKSAEEAMTYLISKNILPVLDSTVELTQVDEYRDTEHTVFSFPILYLDSLIRYGELAKDELYGSDLSMVLGTDAQCSEIFQQMSDWLALPSTQEDALNTDNDIVLLKTHIDNKYAVLVFDLGGSDNGAYKLQQLNHIFNLTYFSKIHAYPEDVQDFIYNEPTDFTNGLDI